MTERKHAEMVNSVVKRDISPKGLMSVLRLFYDALNWTEVRTDGLRYKLGHIYLNKCFIYLIIFKQRELCT